MSVVPFPALPETAHAQEMQRVWRALLKGSDHNPSMALAEAAHWIVSARELMTQASPRLDAMFQAQIAELCERMKS